MTTIRNPVEWGVDHLGEAATSMAAAVNALGRTVEDHHSRVPVIRRIGYPDLKAALREGFDDFVACRSDVLAIGLIYPLAGVVLGHVALHAALAPMLFPLIAGFALIGPFAAIGLYEASRRREKGEAVGWSYVTDAFTSPSASAIWTLGLAMTALFLVWLAAAALIYMATMGPAFPASLGAFAGDVVSTRGGLAMIVIGCAVGAGFAVAALAVSVVSFPLLLDRRVSVTTAVRTSVEAVRLNPGPMFAWGAIVAGLLALGALPLLTGLIVVMPVLGHATWRLYRRVVA